MITKGSGFTLIELLVVVAILGILAAVGTVSYTGYVEGAKRKTAENAMQQIGLAQTEEYSNSAEYYTQGDDCDPSEATSNAIESNLLDGADVITRDSGYEMCIEEDGTSYIVKAISGDTTITMTANGVWGE